jgi:hypothetical protein
VPDGMRMQILAGTPSDPAMSYGFTVEAEPSGPAPKCVEWIDSSQIFVNTGRWPLFAFDYLFDARCGNAGFRPLSCGKSRAALWKRRPATSSALRGAELLEVPRGVALLRVTRDEVAEVGLALGRAAGA